jgi:DUF4097 and DUF4098 domain-containing protein YvlB
VLFSLAGTALAALALVQQIDTTIPAQRGQRLEVNVYGGDIDVKTWGRNAVRLEASPSSRTSVQVQATSAVVSVRTEGRRGPPATVDMTVTVPAWMAIDLSGVYTDVTVEGSRAPVTVETVQGDVDVDGGAELISLHSVQGHIRLTGAKGRMEVRSVNEDVVVRDAEGDLTAETVNGSVDLSGVRATNLEATTVNGDVTYDGPIRNDGRYTLSSHNGDVSLAVAEGTSATISVSTFSGEFESAFPVTLRETRKGRRFNFTLGGGSAQVSLESFQGTVSLVRPGTTPRTKGDDDSNR